MRRRLEVAIAGAGVAGLAAATFLARAGHRVTLFDQLQSPQPIGSGLILQPVGIAALAALDLEGEAIALGARIDRLLGRTVPSGDVALDVRYRALARDACGFGIHRGALFALLLAAARGAGAAIAPGREVRAAASEAGLRLRFADGSSDGAFDLIIDALGVRSPLSPDPGRPLAYGALWANVAWPDAGGFDANALEQRYERARRMVGLMPIGRPPGEARPMGAFFWSLRGDAHAAWRDAPFADWKAEVAALWPEIAPVLEQLVGHEDLVFARYAHRTLWSPVSDTPRGLVHIGDSYHAASPQLGQGANMALLDAWALAAAIESEPDIAAALSRFAALRRWHVRIYQWASAAFTPFYQSDGAALPWLRDRIVAPLSQLPPAPAILAGLVAGALANPVRAIAARAPARLDAGSNAVAAVIPLKP